MTSAAQSMLREFWLGTLNILDECLNAHLHLFITLTADTSRGDIVKVVGLLNYR